MITTASLEPRKDRRLRAVADIAAAAMIATGALLVGIAVSQHQHHDHALAVQAARKAQVDRAAVVEAQQFRPTTRPQAHDALQAHQGHLAPQTDPAVVSARVDRYLPARGQQLRAPARGQQLRAPATAHQLAVRPATRHLQAARLQSPGVTGRGAVSEIRATGAVLVIPALQVRAPVVATGAVDGSMTIPADVHTVGWYDGVDTTGGGTVSAPTPWPGQPGVSLLAGHIDWVGQGPGALYYIGQLVPGDPVEVIGSNGVATYWRVSQPPITVAKADLPADLFVNTGPPKLALVTCGGPYDPATGHYLDNVIVWATLAR